MFNDIKKENKIVKSKSVCQQCKKHDMLQTKVINNQVKTVCMSCGYIK